MNVKLVKTFCRVTNNLISNVEMQNSGACCDKLQLHSKDKEFSHRCLIQNTLKEYNPLFGNRSQQICRGLHVLHEGGRGGEAGHPQRGGRVQVRE